MFSEHKNGAGDGDRKPTYTSNVVKKGVSTHLFSHGLNWGLKYSNLIFIPYSHRQYALSRQNDVVKTH